MFVNVLAVVVFCLAMKVSFSASGVVCQERNVESLNVCEKDVGCV